MKPRTIALVCVWTVPSAIFLLVTALVYSAFRIAPATRLGAADRASVLATVRAALDGTSAPCTVHHPIAGAVAVTLWLATCDGAIFTR